MAEQEETFGYHYVTEDDDRGLLDPAWEKQQKKVCFGNSCIKTKQS